MGGHREEGRLVHDRVLVTCEPRRQYLWACSTIRHFGWIASRANRPDNPFGVCSRNFELERVETNAWWEAAVKYGIEGKLAALGREIAVQGELVGPGMNGNRDLLPEREFRVFRIWDIANGRYLGSTERRELCASLGLPHVKVIDPAMDVFSELPSVDAVR